MFDGGCAYVQRRVKIYALWIVKPPAPSGGRLSRNAEHEMKMPRGRSRAAAGHVAQIGTIRAIFATDSDSNDSFYGGAIAIVYWHDRSYLKS
jgi:hypothetical protein